MSKELKIKGALSKDYQQLYIDDSPTNLFINEEGKIKTATIRQEDANEVKILGDGLVTPKNLQIKYNDENKVDLTVADDGHLTIAGTGTDADFTLDIPGDIEINADGGQVKITDGTPTHFMFNCDTTRFIIYDDADTSDYIAMKTTTNGVSEIYTNDNDGTVGHLSLIPDGDLILDPASHTISALDNAIGFTQEEPTFDATDTIITFSTTGNKAKLTLTNNCADIHFKFPAVSGNFICVLLQDGTGGRTISNWKTQDSAGNAGAGNSGLVLWAGGTAPSNTETADKADIASFYWDADNEIAYGTYTYNF